MPVGQTPSHGSLALLPPTTRRVVLRRPDPASSSETTTVRRLARLGEFCWPRLMVPAASDERLGKGRLTRPGQANQDQQNLRLEE